MLGTAVGGRHGRGRAQCLQRHVVRGSRDLSLHGQVDQKGTDFWGAQVRRVARVMHEDNALGAGHIRLCRSDTQVFEASDMPHRIESWCC